MNSGSYDRQVSLMANNVTRGAGGEATNTWVEVEKLWMKKPLVKSGSFVQPNGAQSNKIIASFEGRYRSTVKPYMRLRFEGVDYEINYIDEIGRRAGMIVYVQSIK